MLINFVLNKLWQWLDSNPGPLVSEATTLPTVPHSLPYYLYDILDTKLPRNRLNFPAMKLILKKMPHNITDNIVKQLSLIGKQIPLLLLSKFSTTKWEEIWHFYSS